MLGNQEAEMSTTSTTQSRSIATPRANPDSLSMAPANTNTTNQGRGSVDVADV